MHMVSHIVSTHLPHVGTVVEADEFEHAHGVDAAHTVDHETGIALEILERPHRGARAGPGHPVGARVGDVIVRRVQPGSALDGRESALLAGPGVHSWVIFAWALLPIYVPWAVWLIEE